jgi:hypothetical protein
MGELLTLQGKCSLFKAIPMYQSILFARGKTGKVKNDAMPPKVGRVASDGKRVAGTSTK